MALQRAGRPSYQAACLAALPLLLAGWFVLPARDELARHVVSDVLFILAPAVAAWRCWRVGTRPWRALAAGCLAWALGSAVWAVEELALGHLSPFPSWSAVGYLAFPPLAVIGLLTLPGLPTRAAGRFRLAIDGLAVASSMLLVAWLGVLGNLQRADDPLTTALALAYPACDLLVAAVAALVLDRVSWRSPAGVAALAVAGVAVTDATYGVLAGAGWYATGGLLDLAWPMAFLVLAWAPSRAKRSAPPVPDRDGSRLLPALPAAIAFAALVVSGRLLHGLDVVLTVDLVLLVGALAARQSMLAAENATLHRSLEDRLGVVTERSHQLAVTDPLTGLPNREAFTDTLGRQVASLVGGQRLGLVMLDLDGFQQVNDAFGHETGDQLLASVAHRLREVLRGGEVLARLAGDEFGVLIPGLRSDSDALAVAARLAACLTEPLRVGALHVVLGASAGVATTDSADITASELLRDADTAMYAAKEAGGAQCLAFTRGMHTVVRERLQLEADLRAALNANALFLHYQPVVDLFSDRVAGFEALARWDHPTRGAVSPVEFIPAAERTGLVVALERTVLDLACAQLALWRREHHALTVAVNVSARHLHEPDFLDVVLDTLRAHTLPPAALVIEVTESLLFHDDDHVRGVLDRLRVAGVGLALDDFGTGYSSLSRLARYPFDTLKIDRAFVMDLEGTSSASPVLTATLAMARGLGMSVVAEGVETEAQLAFLLEHGCDRAQGFLLSRPGLARDVTGTLGRSLLPAPRSGEGAVLPR